jgi:rhodanese-related sulfurtransferase
MKRTEWALVALIVVLVAGMIYALSPHGPKPGLIDGEQLSDLQSSGARIIDVRTSAEFEAGHIPDAENIPLGEIAGAAASWDPAEPIVLYCATGSRSAEAAQMLQAKGFTAVYDLAGGIAAWSGSTQDGAAVAAVQQQPTETPVLYEFYTDW